MRKLILGLACLALGTSCNTPSKEAGLNLIGLASPIQLEENDSTLVLLEDYFLDPSVINHVQVPEGWEYTINTNGDSLWLYSTVRPNRLYNLNVEFGNQQVDILTLSSRKRKSRIELKDSSYELAQLKGEMTNWQLVDGQLEDGKWIFDFSLNPNAYQYMFVVDGQEMLDPVNEQKIDNGNGGFNSLLDLRASEKEKESRLVLKTRTHTENSISIQCSGALDQLSIFPYLNNTLLDYQLEGDLLTISFPALEGRSKIRVFASNVYGPSNDILIPLENGEVIRNTDLLTRSDHEAQIMYFTLVDRFNNGNESNDAPLEDERLYDKANYQGGDLAGITEKIRSGYFKSLGINSIWLSPITQNPQGAFQEYIEPKNFYSGYHGYWPISSSKIDHRFGTDEEMEELVQVAHENGIAILLDYVCNHVHQEHPIIKNNPEYASVFELEGGRKNLRLWDEQRLTTWFDEFLPSLDLENPEVVDLQVDSTMYWIEKFGFDGFRHDATKHIPLAFWRQLTRRLKEERMSKGESVYQIGETYGSRDLVKSYISSGMLDSQFDFNMYFDSRSTFAYQEPSFTGVADALEQSLSYYGHHNTMGYMTGNHDQARFISYAGGALSMNEDPRAAGFEREVGVGDDLGYDKLQMMTAFYLSIPGVPTIFYGDEIGMPGANDPDNRDLMRFDGLSELEKATLNSSSKMANLRRSSMSLIYGDTRIISSGPSHLVIERSYFDEVSYCIFNKAMTSELFEIDIEDYRGLDFQLAHGNNNNSLKKTNGMLSVELAPWSFEIIQSRK